MFDNDIYYYTKVANIISDYFEIQKQRFTKYNLTVETNHHIDSEDFCWGRYCVFESKEWSNSLLMMKEKKKSHYRVLTNMLIYLLIEFIFQLLNGMIDL